MVARRRKKSSRHHGSHTHGWGAMKKHRGKGHQGGAGMAGTGKRADQKKPSIWADENYFGKRGFVFQGAKVKINAINLETIREHLSRWMREKKISKEGDIYHIDLGTLGYNKLLGAGNVNEKLKITVTHASEGAVSKVKEKGGDVSIKGE